MRIRKIVFKRQSWAKWKKIKRKADVWRRPRGSDSKLRRKMKGYGRLVEVGYRVPKKIRYLHPCGKKEVLIHNVKELGNYNPEEYCIRISGKVGKRKAIEIFNKAKEMGFYVLNPPKVK